MKLAILGNTPELSALELDVEWEGGQIARVETSPELSRLGGTVKLANVIDGDIQQIDKLLEAILPDHKLVFGFSVYAGDGMVTESKLRDYAKKLQGIGMNWKKQLKTSGRSVRFVVSKEPALSSVIVTKEHLLKDQTDFVIVLYQNKTMVGRTIAVQDFKEFSRRDYGRPQRDAFSGMLPPKVARMMVNIAGRGSLLDPFCGSGTIIQEALTLGFTNVIGSDISQKCIDDTQANIAWAKLPQPTLVVSDVLKLNKVLHKQVDVIVTEGYLGPVHPKNITQLQSELTSFYTEVFVQLRLLLAPAARLVVALPAWRKNGKAIQTLSLPLAQLGYSAFHTPVIYGRPDAKVLRQIIFLTSQYR